ncbi:MAG: hypothetical protein GY696_14730, partial [Gammaproteobacteria bacterium]|nr:hypothetical protein [Gammaproteobacteria bacterium]
MLDTLLIGPAKEELRACRIAKMDAKKTLASLANSFSPRKSCETYLSEAQALRQRDDQTVHQFGTEVVSKLRRAYPRYKGRSKESLDQDFLMYFLRGLRPEIKRPVKLTTPATFAVAMERALHTERVIGDDELEDRPTNRSRGTKGFNNLENVDEAEEEEVDEKTVNAVINEEGMKKLEQDRLKGNQRQFNSHINPSEKPQQNTQRVQGQLRGVSERVGAVEGDMTSIKAMAEEMLGYLKPQALPKQVTNVQAVEPSKPPPQPFIPRDRKLCDYCGRTGHDKSTCFLDPAGEFYKPEYAKFVNDRSKKEKKNYNNIIRKKASKQQCNDSSETSEEESDEDDHKAKKTNRTKQKVNFANMILQSMAKEVRSSKSHSGSKGKGPSDAMLAMGLLGTTIKNAVMKLLPRSDKVVTNLAVELQRDDEVACQRKALAERVIPPQFNCVPHKVSDRTLPRRKVLPKVAPHIQDSAKAWRELRKMSQMAAARRNDDK